MDSEAVAGHTIARINDLASRGEAFLLVVDFELKQPEVWPIEEVPRDISFMTPEINHNDLPADQSFRCSYEKQVLPYNAYLGAFTEVKKQILAGNTFLLNLTFPTLLGSDLSLPDIYRRSKAKYKLFYRDRFVVFSPETFVRTKGRQIYSYPMKGTIDASLKDADRLILDDVKEKAEHVTIVDLVRNDLSIHSDQVQVNQFRYLDRIRTDHSQLLQVSSEISGRMPADYHRRLGEIIFSMLPAGSISGAPKPSTLRIIRNVEGIPRGHYTGIMGYYNGKDFDSGVLIRYIERKGDRFYYRSGGGITFMSEPDAEYQELIDKIYVPLN